MHATAVDRLHEEFADLLTGLDANDVSRRSVADDNFRKILLMAAASYFEKSLSDAVIHFAEGATAESHPLMWLVKNKAVSRQYHTWFDWDTKNANKFFRLFGESFKDHMATRVEEDEELKDSIRAFLEIGSERNRLVHEDFANLSLEKTTQEIYKLYSDARVFVDSFPNSLHEFVVDLSRKESRAT